MTRLLLALLPLAHCQPAQFLGRYLLDESGQQCLGNDRPCEDGVDCCGICAYIGADSWRCMACTEVGDECIPMGNRCCSGGNKQKDVLVSNPNHSCQATNETSEEYGTTKYTCQAVNASGSSAEIESNNSAIMLQASASTGRGVESYVRYQGKATDKQVGDLRDFAYHCFQRHPVRTSNLGELQGSLGSAIGCVLQRCRAKWGWKPVLSQSGSDNGGPYEGFGRQSTVVTVDTPSGKWQFVLKMQGSSQGSSHGPRPSPGRAVRAQIHHRGDATREQARDLRRFAGACFKQHSIDTSNVGALDGSLGRAIGCVTSRCERKWGWKPFVSQEGSDNGGPYSAYGRGATVVGVETSSGKWEFVLRLKS